VVVYEAGQWADATLAASSGLGTAASVQGAPDDVAWTPDGGWAREFITVGFASAAYATGVLVRGESGGAVSQVDLIDTSGTAHTIWSGKDPAAGAGDFVLNFATTAYQVQAVTVYTTGVDAVRLLTGGTASSLKLTGRAFDGGGDYMTTDYNSAGQPTEVKTYTQGSLVRTEAGSYDTSGFLATQDVTDADGRTTRTTFDSAGHKTSETLAYGTSGAATTTFTYDTNGQLTQVEDPDSNVTTYTYDALDQSRSPGVRRGG
jgi:YD repeat-containing protein